MRTTKALILWPWALLLTLGCGATSTATAGHRRGPVHARDLYPLVMGSAWSYDVDTGDEDLHLAISRVLSVRDREVEVSNGVDDVPLRYEIRPQGIWRPDLDVWLVRDPIRVGTEWPSTHSATARIASISRRVRTTAGTFTDCVLVVETGGDLGRRVDTTYCPDVGPVVVDVHMHLTLSDAHTVARLRGYVVGDGPATGRE